MGPDGARINFTAWFVLGLIPLYDSPINYASKPFVQYREKSSWPMFSHQYYPYGNGFICF